MSVTRTVKSYVPEVVGLPESWPLLLTVAMVRPGGGVPPAMRVAKNVCTAATIESAARERQLSDVSSLRSCGLVT